MGRALNFHGGGLVGDTLYTLAFDGALAKINIRIGDICLVYPHLPVKGNLRVFGGARWVIPLNDKIYFTYGNFKMLGVLALHSREVAFREIRMDACLRDKRLVPLGYRDGKVYCHILSGQKLLEIDLESFQGKCSDKEILQDESFIFDCGGGIPYRKRFFIEMKNRMFVEYDLDAQGCSRTKLPKALPEIDSFTVQGDAVYILGRNGSLWSWNRISSALVKICVLGYKGTADRISMLMTVAGTKLYIWPAYENEIVCVNTESGCREAVEFPADFGWLESPHNKVPRYNYCIQDGSYIYIFPKTTNYMSVLSKKDGGIRWIDVRIPDREWTKYMVDVINEDLFAESGSGSLGAFLEVACRSCER